ncbi:MAG: thiamine-phosphate kinase [Rhodothalassiaceae bacterium]
MSAPSEALSEFDLIERLFRPLSGPGARALVDDAGILAPPPGSDVIVTKDLMVEGRHWLPDTDPALVAEKLLAVNLSDLAAMGAGPQGYLLGLVLPAPLDMAWPSRFAEGLGRAQSHHGIALLGGDTTRSGPGGARMLSLTAFGWVENGRALYRSRAEPGQQVYVSGTIGDAALGLKMAQGAVPPDTAMLDRLHRPTPRLALGRALVASAGACIDISDGLLADAGHVAKASGVALKLFAPRIPLSPSARAWVGEDVDRLMELVTGGDDYELLFTAPPGLPSSLAGVAVTAIGTVEEGAGVRLLDAHGRAIAVNRAGYDHFRGAEG